MHTLINPAFPASAFRGRIPILQYTLVRDGMAYNTDLDGTHCYPVGTDNQLPPLVIPHAAIKTGTQYKTTSYTARGPYRSR